MNILQRAKNMITRDDSNKGESVKVETNSVESNKEVMSWFLSTDAYDTLCISDYTRLVDNAEFKTGLNIIADLVSDMSIMLMKNTEHGDERIKNELSRKIDFNPNDKMTRKKFMKFVVYNLLENGNQVTLPKHDREGLLLSLDPQLNEKVSFNDLTDDYEIIINGVSFSYEEVLHFTLNPRTDSLFIGQGYEVQLRDIVNNLKQATSTKRAFMSSKYMPPIIVSVDTTSNKSLNTKEGRDKVLKDYIETDNGKPWVIPATSMDVKQVKPLTLADIAINESVEIDKKTVAAVLGIPAFLLGVGEYSEEEYNSFISRTIQPIAKAIEQEMTRKLILSSSMYLKFNVRSLYRYSLTTVKDVYGDLFNRGIVTGNEVRDELGMSFKKELNELIILENYIPASEVGKQSKLNGGDDSGS